MSKISELSDVCITPGGPPRKFPRTLKHLEISAGCCGDTPTRRFFGEFFILSSRTATALLGATVRNGPVQGLSTTNYNPDTRSTTDRPLTNQKPATALFWETRLTGRYPTRGPNITSNQRSKYNSQSEQCIRVLPQI
jgi:hypothetical protein